MANEELSSRIEILRFPLIVGVVFVHNYDTTVHLASGSIGGTHTASGVDFVRILVSQGIARIAVPLFFLISGYLFFTGGWSTEKYLGKLHRRFHTLLIPFLFWNLLTLLVHAVGEGLPQTRAYIANNLWPPVHSFSPFEFVNALVGITQYPISYQFWFIRDLMTLVLLALVIHFLLARRSAGPLIAILFCLWFLKVWPLPWPSVDATFFFTLGALCALSGVNLNFLDEQGPWISVIFLAALVLNSAFSDSLSYLHKTMIVFGVPAAWWATRLVVRRAAFKSLLSRLSEPSFFVFAAHEPLLTVIRNVSYKLLAPTNGAVILALYFLIPICLIAFLVALYYSLLKVMPSFLGIVAGRSSVPVQSRAKESVLVSRA